MSAPRATLALVSDDPALGVAIEAAFAPLRDRFAVARLSHQGGAAALRQIGAALMLVDLDSGADPTATLALAFLVQAAPILALGVHVGGGEAALREAGAAGVLAKRSGPAAPTLAGADADALRALALGLIAAAAGSRA